MCNCTDLKDEAACESCEIERTYEEDLELAEALSESEEFSETQEDRNAAVLSGLEDNIGFFSAEDIKKVKEILASRFSSKKDEIYEEAEELGAKIDRLHRYLKGYNVDGVRLTKADCLPDATIYLLQEQEKAMMTYYNCLVARHSIWGVKKDEQI